MGSVGGFFHEPLHMIRLCAVMINAGSLNAMKIFSLVYKCTLEEVGSSYDFCVFSPRADVLVSVVLFCKI